MTNTAAPKLSPAMQMALDFIRSEKPWEVFTAGACVPAPQFRTYDALISRGHVAIRDGRFVATE